jgi:ABC-type nitrate/sulfonate/bicarbonate transport system ATPase subunit
MTQDDLMLPWRTVLENLLLVGELGRKPKSLDALKQEALRYLEEMGLSGWENAYPDQLSGGMRQRVSLTRALLQKRPLLLLDEPFGALDVGLREQMHTLLRSIRKQHGTTILMITHDFRDALSLSDRIFLLDKGRICADWSVAPTIRQDAVAYQRLHNELYEAIRK